MNIIRHYLKKLRYIEDSAFTLIELLVVIAIIGTLSTIAFVSLQSAQDNADDSKDIAQLRSLELALIQHKSTAGGFPAAGGADNCVTLSAGAAGNPKLGSIEEALDSALPTFNWSDQNYFYCSDKAQGATPVSNVNTGTKYVLGVKNISTANKVLGTDKDGAIPITGITMDGHATAYDVTTKTGGCGDVATTGSIDNVYCLVGGVS